MCVLYVYVTTAFYAQVLQSAVQGCLFVFKGLILNNL